LSFPPHIAKAAPSKALLKSKRILFLSAIDIDSIPEHILFSIRGKGRKKLSGE
jgi:hypothetical protein